jgi:hypothetical protein
MVFKYQVYKYKEPDTVLAVIESNDRGKAWTLAQSKYGKDAGVRLPEERPKHTGQSSVAEQGAKRSKPITLGKTERTVTLREIGQVHNATLREVPTPLGTVQALVVNAVLADVGASHGIEVLNDNTVRYSVGSDLFERTWSISDGGEVSLGQPQRIQMVPEPVEASVVFALRGNPDERVTIRAESREEARRHMRALNEIAEAWGLSERATLEFVRGRDGTRDSLVDAARALGLEGRKLQEFLRGRD